MSKLIKLAQPGYDVKTAGDQNLIFSSRWPLLKIYKSGKTTVYDTTATQTIASHDLGFTPAFWYFANDRRTDRSQVTAGSPIQTDDRSEFQGNNLSGFIAINDKELFYKPGSSIIGNSGGIDIYYYIFTIDITKDYIAPSIRTGDQPQGEANSSPVFKVALPGKNVHSTSLEDFAIHSDTRSPLIHSVRVGDVSPDASSPGNYIATFSHNLGYNPIIFGYIKGIVSGAYTTIFSSTDGSGAGFYTDAQNAYGKTAAAGRSFSIFILKDPFDISYRVNVVV